MALETKTSQMKRHGNLYKNLCSYENLECAYKKARKRKTEKPYVIEFEKNLKENIGQLRTELLLHCYKPKPLVNFIVRDPKTRKSQQLNAPFLIDVYYQYIVIYRRSI